MIFMTISVVAEELRFDAFGVNVVIRSEEKGGKCALKIAVTPSPANSVSLLVTHAETGREQAFRKYITAGKYPEVIMTFPLQMPNGFNERNIYRFPVSLSTSDGRTHTEVFVWKGAKADPARLGMVIPDARDISESPFGVCTHFGHKWKEVDLLLDMIARLGIKTIRDDVYTEKQKDGSYKVRASDLEWIRKAHERGLRIIPIIAMKAADSQEEFLKQVEAYVRDTEGLVDVFELGNEPGNFGGWRKVYPNGTWNAKERDNSTSRWALEHLKYTNAGAEYIRKLRPDAVILGGGHSSAVNFRILEAGVSPAVDGIVSHFYTYSLPPEKMPWGLKLETRDGIAVGDENNTFRGLVLSYEKKFASTGKMRGLYVTEFGFPAHYFNGKNEKNLYAGFTEEAQAVYTVRRMLESLTLPVIKLSCVYDFMNDGMAEDNPEFNFGMIRKDYSPKPLYQAMGLLTSLFTGMRHDLSVNVEILSQPLHRNAVRTELVKNWDGNSIMAANEVKAYLFADPERPDEKTLAVWSAQPLPGDFNNRSVSIALANMPGFKEQPVGIDLVTGETFDISMKVEEERILLENLSLKRHPIAIRFFR